MKQIYYKKYISFLCLAVIIVLLPAFYGCQKKGCGTNWKDQPLRDSLIKKTATIPTQELEKAINQGKTKDIYYDAIYANELGIRYRNDMDVKKAIFWHEYALDRAKVTNDSILVGTCLCDLSFDYIYADFYKGAFDYAKQAEKIAYNLYKNNPENPIVVDIYLTALRRYGHAAISINQFELGRKCFFETLRLIRSSGDIATSSKYEAMVGSSYEAEGRLDSAEYYYRLSLIHNTFETNSVGRSFCYIHLGNILRSRGFIKESVEMYEGGYKAIQDMGNSQYRIDALQPLIESLFAIGEYEQGYEATLKGLKYSDSVKSTDVKIQMYKYLTQYYIHKGDFKNAVGVNQKIDSLKRLQSKQQTDAELYEVELNYIKSKNQEKINEITSAQEKELTQRNIINVLLILLVIALIITSVITYYLFKLKYTHDKNIKELMLSKARLYGNLIREFRTPLTIIMGYSEYLKRENKTIAQDEKIHLLNIIENQTHELINLANQMLSVDKVKEGDQVSQWVKGNISLFVQMLVEKFAEVAENENKNIIFKTSDWKIEGYFAPFMLEQVTNHLTVYAIARSIQNAEIIISVNREQHEQFSVSISADSTALNAEKLKRMFESKELVSETTETDLGLRIDLSYVKQLIEVVGGKVKIECSDRNTSFKVIFPLKDEKSIKQKSESVMNKEEIKYALGIVNKMITSLHNKKENKKDKEAFANEEDISLDENDSRDVILVVEDNIEVTKYICKILRNKYQILTATDEKEAIDKTLEYYPDLVVINKVLEGVSGADICRKIKNDSRTSYIPVIMLTSMARSREQSETLRDGADAYLMKPFLEEDLINSIGNMLKLCHSQRNTIERSYSLQTKQNVIEQNEKLSDKKNEEVKTEKEDKVSIDPEKLEGYDKEFFEKLSKCITENIADPDFDRNEMANAMNLSLSQLSRKVKSLTGQSPSAYIRKIRISCAEELLKDSSKTITDIAYELGFKDYQTFLRAFKSEMGYLPSQTQKQND